MNFAILCNSGSSAGSTRPELISLLHEKGERVFLGGVAEDTVNPFFSPETAEFMPIRASRANTNPFAELASALSVKKQVKKNGIGGAIVYGVKNHAAMAIGARMGGCKRVICVVNGSGNLFHVSGFKGALLRLAAFPAMRLAYRLSCGVCFQNEDDMRLFIEKKLVKRSDRLFVTNGSGVNCDKYPVRPLPEKNSFLYLARITPTKGVFEYIEAARRVKARYPEAEFHIVGPLDGSIERLHSGEIDEAVNNGTVVYHGKTNDVPSFLAACRCFVYPSYYPEGVPRSVLQALSTGRPVITCDTPGCRVTVDEGENGYKVPMKDPAALAERMISIIEDPERTERMALRSAEIARERFNVFDINRQLVRRLTGE